MEAMKLTNNEIGNAFKTFFTKSHLDNIVDDAAGGEIKNAISSIRAKQAFKDFMAQHNITNTLQGLTLSISFGGVALYNWIAKLIVADPVPDEFRFFFGIYTDDFVNEDHFNEDNIGRITVIVTPFLNGTPLKQITPQGKGTAENVNSYDLGNLHP